STQKGRELYNTLPDEIKKPDMTAKWWAIQEKIKEGEATPEDLYKDVLDTVNRIISQRYSFSIGKSRFDHSGLPKDAVVVGKCPRCGGEVLENSMGFGCINWAQPHNCKFVIWKNQKQQPLRDFPIDADIARGLLQGKEMTLCTSEGIKKQITIKLEDKKTSQYGPRLTVVSFKQEQPVQQNPE
ncbi:MAG: hypothetical protein RR011_05180, partial [Oscillospiraceae bacterium]